MPTPISPPRRKSAREAPPPAALERHYTVSAVCQSIGVDAHKILNAIRDGDLRAVNMSQGDKRPRWRIPASAVAEFLAARSHAQEVGR